MTFFQAMKAGLLAAGFGLIAACATPAGISAPVPEVVMEADAAAIRALLERQDAAWNRGDIDAFMEGYWISDRLRFGSGGTVTYGYDETLARYKANYADPSKMGQLAFTDLQIDQVSADAAVVHGRWQLTRAEDRPGGLFTLVFRKFDGDWVIVSDTTTSAD